MLTDFFAAESVLPLLDLGGRDERKQVFRLAELVARFDRVDNPAIRNSRLAVDTELLKDRLGCVRQEGADQRCDEVDLVQCVADHGSATVRLLGQQLVVKLVVLEQLVSKSVSTVSGRC